MKGTLEKRLLLLCFFALAITIAVNTGFSVESFRRQYREGILRRCNTLATALKGQVERILALGIPLGQIEGLSERCQTVTTNDPEISYCLIEDARGTILYRSTTLPFEPANSRLSGHITDQISILDTTEYGRMYDLSLPIYDFEDKLAGRIRIGFQETVLKVLTGEHLLWSLLVLGGASAAVFALMILFIRRDLVMPVRRMCATATTIAAGDFNVKLPPMESRELAMLGDALSEMASSLLQRDVELRNRYRDLEDANSELQLSYERLEALSGDLGRSREMYRSLLDDASDAILVCDEDDRVLMVNKSAEQFFGLPRIRVEGENIRAFLQDVRCHNFPEIDSWYQAIRPGRASDTEIRFVHPLEKKSLVGWVTGAAIVGKSGRRFVQLIIRDATREEEVRQQLERAARELERLNMMKNSFLGLASHELKTPLTIILGYVELLLNEMAERLDDGTREMLRHIGRASERLSEIVRDMVDVSMLDNRTLELMSQEINANALVDSAVEKSREAIRQRRQKLHLELADGLPMVRCDQERMTQAISNVLGNAIKFTPDYGLIRVRTRLVMRQRLPERFVAEGIDGICAVDNSLYPYVEIAVIDSGIGVARNEQETIFDKFYEVGDVEEHSSGKVAFKSRGAGLGLTIVKGVVDMHGGAVWVESPGYDPERFPGSTFYVLLPTAPPSVTDIPA
ncbi:MAG: ATP-binding protein [Desulfuromonadales bacterium]|nr:ATP-binding protein [Desulfuromonadales bacterium]